jgi:hypothetical protein
MCPVITRSPLATYNLQKQNSKAINVVFHRVYTFFNIFGRNIATILHVTMKMISIWNQKKEKEMCKISSKGTLLTMFQQSDLCLLQDHPS